MTQKLIELYDEIEKEALKRVEKIRKQKAIRTKSDGQSGDDI